MATEADIQAAEIRLGMRLPPSYRDRLLAGIGLGGTHGLRLLPVDEVDRFARREPDSVEAWMDGVRSVGAPSGIDPLRDDPMDPATMPSDELGATIVVSTTSDMRVLLINPARVDHDGEWEAWDFATWYPGAYRYASFAKLADAIADE